MPFVTDKNKFLMETGRCMSISWPWTLFNNAWCNRVKPLLHGSAICRRLTIRSDLMLRAHKGAVFKLTVRNVVIGIVQGMHDPAWICASTLTSWSILRFVLEGSHYTTFWQRDKTPHRFGAVTTMTITRNTLGGPKTLFRFHLNSCRLCVLFQLLPHLLQSLLKVVVSEPNAWKTA